MVSPPKKIWTSSSRREPRKPGSPTPEQPVRRQPDTLNPYLQGDPIPKPDAVELDTDTTWAEFAKLEAAENRKFADTAPASKGFRETEARGYAPTTPAPLQMLNARPAAPVVRALTDVEVMVEARRNNRVCPKPARWQELYDMLPGKRVVGASPEPSLPLLGDAWNATSSIPKRMCLREHIEWAAAQGFLPQLYAFMTSLPEEDWHHMGD